MRVIFDIETYKNVFTLTACTPDGVLWWYYEISDWRNDRADLFAWLVSLGRDGEMVGFNNVAFDYPVLHAFIQSGGKATAYDLYLKAQSLIQTQDEDRFANIVYPSDRYVKQLDLRLTWHFDNKARMTSLKALEFNMRLDSVEDLPFPVGTLLTQEQAKVLRAYNRHDVEATRLFYHESKELIQLREELSAEYGKDFLNHNDTKIGAEIFQMALEKAGVQCYEYGKSGRKPRQTQRQIIHLRECIPAFIEFKNPEFDRIKNWFAAQSITQTKGEIKDVIAHVNGLDYVFGTGGMHASVENTIYTADDEWMIWDIDVAGLYPSIAISRGYYPEHLGEGFINIYKEKIVDERKKYPKGTPKNAAFKLAGNGAYGKSNDKYSIFYDPLFTMKITISGQMMIVMLAEWLLTVEGLEVIQCNTDGITMYMRRADKVKVDAICQQWEGLTGLVLEYVEYKKMVIADVNSYLAQKTDGSTKLKGRYDHVKVTGGLRDWHKDMSCLVVPKVAEKVLLEGAPIAETVRNWSDLFDFFCRVKVPRNSRLEGDGKPLPNMLRYYVSEGGVSLTKIMPPLAKKPDVWRRIGVESGWTVCPCNHVRDAVLPVNYTYYINEVEKLTLALKER